MRSRASKPFWDRFHKLPPEIRDEAREAYRLFCEDPRHPSLWFKKVHGAEPVYSVRIARGFRALGRLDGDLVVWFWIGPHDEYMRLLGQR